MKRFALAAVAQVLFLLAIGNNVSNGEKRVVCYFVGFIVNGTRTLKPDDMDLSLCTHLEYSSFRISDETGTIVPVNFHGHYNLKDYTDQIIRIKERKPQLKVLLHVTRRMSERKIPKTISKRRTLINSAVELVRSTGVDGLDFEMIYSLEDDTGRFGRFMCELRTEFDKHGYILTTNLPESRSATYVRSDIDGIKRCCDFVTFRTYGYWGPWENVTGIHAPLNSVEADIDFYLAENFPAEKMVVSIPTYGMIAKLKNVSDTALGADISGSGGDESGFSSSNWIPYITLIRRFGNQSENWTVRRDERSSTPYAYNTQGLWVTYDDVPSVTAKAQCILRKGLGGALIVTMDFDDFAGIGSEGRFPLTRAIHDALIEGA